jgi:hypothetical protein
MVIGGVTAQSDGEPEPGTDDRNAQYAGAGNTQYAGAGSA